MSDDVSGPEPGGRAGSARGALPGSPQRLLDELADLRRGWGLNSPALAGRVGPGLARLADLPPRAPDAEVCRKLGILFDRLLQGAPAQAARVVAVALGTAPGAELDQGRRTDMLAGELYCSDRNARRKVVAAFTLLARAGAEELEALARGRPGQKYDWYVKRFEALLRLDLDGPELTEQRLIVSRWDDVRRIFTRLTVLKHGQTALTPQDLRIETCFGVRVARIEQENEEHFNIALNLPGPLSRGQEFEYRLSFRLPPGWPMAPRLSFVPLMDCDSFRLRVRFDQDRLPGAVWRLDGLAPRAQDHRADPGPRMAPDLHGETLAHFDRPMVGHAYGVAWLPGRAGD